jgi:hypothetical protein
VPEEVAEMQRRLARQAEQLARQQRELPSALGMWMPETVSLISIHNKVMIKGSTFGFTFKTAAVQNGEKPSKR